MAVDWGSSSTNWCRTSSFSFRFLTWLLERLSSSGMKGGMGKYRCWLNWLGNDEEDDLSFLTPFEGGLLMMISGDFFISRMMAWTICPRSDCSEYWTRKPLKKLIFLLFLTFGFAYINQSWGENSSPVSNPIMFYESFRWDKNSWCLRRKVWGKQNF